jgi:nickel superoxide dismutase
MIFIKPIYAHCDLPCGVYDPSQALVEAQSVHKTLEKYDSLDDINKTRAIIIKEERLELTKKHLWVLWTDYFKPEHLVAHPDLHDIFWQATKQAGKVKKTVDSAESQKLVDMIKDIAKIYHETSKA